MAKTFVCSKTEPIVSTKAGKIRGFILDGTHTFHGIKYADAKRFQAPTEVEPWEGVKDALSYGYVCPLMSQDKPSGELLVPHRYWPEDEHCQYLNIWTQSIDAAAKKPVMVWLHGGGFFAGSSIEQQAYDGANLSKSGDVVVVSLNHRLNVLGYLDLSPFGEKYKNSANAGNDDMIAALKWIKENIAAFGGDPDNVTLFGQSGGGMKVWSLMQMPAAYGLFHKGVVQSGVINSIIKMDKTDGSKIVKAMLSELNIPENEIEKLEAVPYSALAAAYAKSAPALEKAGEYVGGSPMQNEFFLGDPREVGFTDFAKTVPLMVGTVFGEFSFLPALSKEEKANDSYVAERIKAAYGEGAEELTELFKKAYPDKHLSDLLFLDSLFRYASLDFILKKAAHSEAPTYSYMFDYEFPFDDGHVAWHCSEIPYVFKNAEMVAICNEPGVTEGLEEQIYMSWVSFARSGNPNHGAIPQWDASTPNEEHVLIFDKKPMVKTNYDHELVKAHDKYAKPFKFGEDQDIQH